MSAPCTRVVRSCSGLFAEMVPQLHTANEMFELFARVFDIVHLKMEPERLDADRALDVVVRICQITYPSLTTAQMCMLLHDHDDGQLADGYDPEWQAYYIQRWHVMQSIFKHISSA